MTAAQVVLIEEAERRRLDREARGLSLREEAARLGISPSRLGRIERGTDSQEEEGNANS